MQENVKQFTRVFSSKCFAESQMKCAFGFHSSESMLQSCFILKVLTLREWLKGFFDEDVFYVAYTFKLAFNNKDIVTVQPVLIFLWFKT